MDHPSPHAEWSPRFTAILAGTFSLAGIVVTALLAFEDRASEFERDPAGFYYVPALFFATAGVICVDRKAPKLGNQGKFTLWVGSGGILLIAAYAFVLFCRQLIIGA